MRAARFLAIALLLAIPERTAQAAALQPGDVLSIQIARFPEFSRNATIADDGTVRVGGAGPLRAAGLTLDDVSAAIAAALKEGLGVDPNSVLVDVAQYRPVVVHGGGLRAAEVPYRPGMKVLHALAASRTRRVAADGSVLELLETERAAARITQHQDRLARALAQKARLVAERDDGRIAAPDLVGLRLPEERVDEILKAEEELRALRKQQLNDQLANLEQQREAVQRQISSLAEELKLQRTREEIAVEALDRLKALDLRGLATQNRLVETNTELLNARLLVIRILSDRAAAETRLAQVDSVANDVKAQRTLELVQLLSQVETEISNARRDLAAARRETGVAEDYLGETTHNPGNQSAYRILRVRVDGKEEALTANLSTRLEPGDVLEVSRE